MRAQEAGGVSGSLRSGMNRQILIAAVVALVSFVGTVMSFREYRTASLLTKVGVQETGVVVGREWQGGKPTSYFLDVRLSGNSVQPNLQSRIQVGQTQYTQYPEGSTVRVLVDPRPRKTAMILAGHSGAWKAPLFSTLFLGVLCALCVTLLVVRLRGRTVTFSSTSL